MSDTLGIWSRTSFPISTHYCDTEIFDAEYARAVMNDDQFKKNFDLAQKYRSDAIDFMRSLCRGGGCATVGATSEDIKKAMEETMTGPKIPVVSRGQAPAPARRVAPGHTEVVRATSEFAANVAHALGHVVEHGARIADAEANIGNLEEKITALASGFSVLAGVVGVTNEVLDRQAAGAAADAEARRISSGKFKDGLQRLGSEILNVVAEDMAGRAAREDQRSLTHVYGGDPVRIAPPSIAGPLTAALGGNSRSTVAVPPPGNVVALPAPSTAEASQAITTNGPRALAPVRRR
jgi:hypothetical protein